MKRSLIDLIRLVREKPAMYIGQHSIIRFSFFISGYDFAVYDREGDKDYYYILARFTDWLAVRYSTTKTYSWKDILLEIAGDDKKAFEIFWNYWDEFLAEKNITSDEINHTQ